ncbi:NAD(P)H-binding protein [Mesorhizobium sp.]|uniref:NAD(P)H-binding protein n=1 Tax=Mesorhizobium sp. TaxID=1871066 RepID=UPI00257CE7C2|nr:NAD(P)H-binding protein [Mesorhizobium sp.]
MFQSPHPSSASDKKAPAETASSSATGTKKVLLVGATGFLGAKILRNLTLDPSGAVVAMSRKGAPSNDSADVEWVRGDMMDPASLDHALQGVDVVVSSANSYMKGSLDTDFQGNKRPQQEPILADLSFSASSVARRRQQCRISTPRKWPRI